MRLLSPASMCLHLQNITQIMEEHLNLPKMDRKLNDEGIPMHLLPWQNLADRLDIALSPRMQSCVE